MSVKIITDFRTLCRLARELAEAEKTEDIELIEEARVRHDAYKQICLNADGMSLGITSGQLQGK